MRLREKAIDSELSISREGLGLLLICMFDTLLTIALLSHGLAVEANPLMARCFEIGVSMFFLVKTVPLLVTVGLAEWHRRRNPQFVKVALRMATAGYLALYIGGILMVNLR